MLKPSHWRYDSGLINPCVLVLLITANGTYHNVFLFGLFRGRSSIYLLKRFSSDDSSLYCCPVCWFSLDLGYCEVDHNLLLPWLFSKCLFLSGMESQLKYRIPPYIAPRLIIAPPIFGTKKHIIKYLNFTFS